MENHVAVAELLSQYRFAHQCEEDLQQAIASVLTSYGVEFQREASLNETDRVDFLIGRLGLEVKIKGSPTEVTRQLHRYAQSDKIDCILLVTAKATHRNLPPEMNGKPINVLYLNPL